MTSDFQPTSISRRTVAKGIAWTAPAVVVAGAAPAFAGSPIPPNGLNGWVQLEKRCSSRSGYYHRVDGFGSYPVRGLWTFVPDPNAVISNASITLYFDRSDLSFVNESERVGGGNSRPAWSNLVRDPSMDASSPENGFYAYTTTYTANAWTYSRTLQGPAGTARGGWIADRDLRFTHTWTQQQCVTLRSYARRTLTVNGETVTFTRGPISV